MKFRILGSASGNPELGKHHSAYYIEMNNKNILLDCGDGISQQLLKFQLADNEIDIIIISHYHPDHISGLFMVLQMFYLRHRTKDLILYLPERKKDFYEILNMFYSFPERFTYKIKYRSVSEISTFFPEITPLVSDHLLSYKNYIKKHDLINPMRSYSFVFKENSQTLLISCDIADTKHFLNVKYEIDTLVIDAFHPTAENILNFAKEIKSKIILTHGISNELKIFIEKNTENFIIADENKIYNV